MRKVLLGAAALLMSGTLAAGGEQLGLKVEVGLDVGVVQSVKVVDADFSNGGADGSSMALVPSLTVTYAFNEQWSASLWLRYLAGFEDDGADVIGAPVDGEVQIGGFDIGGLAGYTFKVDDQFSVTPLAGLSYRTYSVDFGIDDVSYDVTEDCSLLVLDLGAKAAYRLNDKFSIPFGLMLGLGVSGSADIGGDEDEDGDLDGIAFLLEVRGGVEYKLNEAISLTGGLAYEMLSVTWDWEGEDTADDDLSRFSIQLGAAFKF